MSEILAIGVGTFGASLGILAGIVLARRLGLTPSAKELEHALDANEDYYKTYIGRLKGKMKEYEQPTELQQFAHAQQGVAPENLAAMLAAELPNVRGIPRWLRPLLPGIIDYVKSNPDQVQTLVQKFITQPRSGEAAQGESL
jgi:Na+/glutamate symporter